MEPVQTTEAPAVRAPNLARAWHWGTFAAGAFGVVSQLLIVWTQTVTEDMAPLSDPIRLWNVLSYFTIWSNIAVTVVAWLLARDPRRDGRVFNAVRLASLSMITITCLIYALVLAKVWDPTGWQKVADETLHYSVPALAIAGYLLFGPRPRFDARTLAWSLVLPLLWIPYTLIRSPFISYQQGGETRHWYPYHFINVDDIGYGGALVNIAGVSVLLLAVGALYLLLDRRLPATPGTR